MPMHSLWQRTRHLLAVYVEPQRVEVLSASRTWRTWQKGSVEQYPLLDGESIYEALQRLNLRPKGNRTTALILFLPRCYYSFHREYYPQALLDQLEETLAFDWPENTFYEQEGTLHFHGTPIPTGDQLIVPVFTLQGEVYEKFNQALGAQAYQNFTVIPSAGAYRSFVASAEIPQNGEGSTRIAARLIAPMQMEIDRFHNGLLQDSILIQKGHDTSKLLLESLRCLGDPALQEGVGIQLLCGYEEASTMESLGQNWKDSHLPMEFQVQREFLLSYWVQDLLQQEKVHGFGSSISLRPWKIPAITWPILGLMILFALFAGYKTYERSRLAESLTRLNAERAQLEAQWRPIEQLQNRIPKLQEGQKALEQFRLESYPVLELLTLLSQVTPDDTWLNFLSLKGKELTVRGESKSAIKYLSELSKVEGLGDVRFASPVSKIPASDKERFHVQCEINVESLKKTLGKMQVDGAMQAAGENTGGAPVLQPAGNPLTPPPEETAVQ